MADREQELLERNVSFHIMRLGTLRKNRGNWNSQWEEAAARVIPALRNSFFGYGWNQVAGNEGQKLTELMYDPTAVLANQRFAAVIESLATPQNSHWHRVVPVNKKLKQNRQVRLFFDDLTDALFSYRYRPVANFVANSQSLYQGIGAFGNGIMFTDTPDETAGLRYRNCHLGQCYFVQNHAGVVDTMYRDIRYTARQAIQEFGHSNVSDMIRMAAENPNLIENRYEFIHVVHPSTDYIPGNLGAGGFKWYSCYIEVQSRHLISEGGYHTFPYSVSRYSQLSWEEYGRGPAQWVLPSINVLNEEKKTLLKQAHRTVDPVYLIHDDGLLNSFSARPGAMNPGGMSADGKPMVAVLPTGSLDIGEKAMELERNIINDAFLINLFQILVQTPEMTATEVLERAREKGMLIAPTAGRIQSEFLGPLIEREVDLLMKQGLLPDIPGALMGTNIEYKVEYDSPMSRMMRAEKAAGYQRAMSEASQQAQLTGDPSALDWFNADVATPEIMDISGSPIAWTCTPEQVAAKRQARQQQQQQQQMIQAGPAMAAMAKAAPEMKQAAQQQQQGGARPTPVR